MTTAQPDRLDRIEALLEQMAVESERSKRESDERMSRMERDFERSYRESDERMSRMETDFERSYRESDERMSRGERRFEENNAAISRDIAQLVATQQEALRERQELREAMIRLADTQEGIARLLGSLDEDRPTILRKLNTIEGKVDSLLQQNQS
jgi:2,3-bisphosphoglycerate-independent phosphoglycerate mutase